MDWSEFCTLLAGIMPKTPLGQIVSIRSEDDKEILKTFNAEQRRIRNKWRSKQVSNMTDEEKEAMVKEMEQIFAKAFG